MKRKLQCVLVDDDVRLAGLVQDLCAKSSLIELIHSFLCPKEFLKAAPGIDFDICLLDLCMPEMNSILVAKQLKGKLIIYVTGQYDNLKDAIESNPVDIIPKPIEHERFYKAIEKAYSIKAMEKAMVGIFNDNERREKYVLFNTAESKEKIRLCLQDIFYVEPDTYDARNKKVIMRDGKQHTLMRCSFEQLLSKALTLIQVNRYELISTEAVQKVRYDLITLKFQDKKETIKQVTLNRTFRKDFMNSVMF